MGSEWTYLLATRKVGGEDSVFSYARIKYGSNATDTVTGVIIYPDDFSFSEAGVASMAFGARLTTEINAADWDALENMGCVFLPNSRHRGFQSDALNIAESDLGMVGFYMSATALDASNMTYVSNNSGTRSTKTNNNGARLYGICVRLVQDLK